MANSFCHIELNTGDVNQARSFYAKIFDWKFEELNMEGTPYTMLHIAEGPGGGMMAKPMPDAPTMWTVYVKVDSIDQTLARAQAADGRVIVPKSPIPGHGHFALLQDPTGAVFGLFEPGK